MCCRCHPPSFRRVVLFIRRARGADELCVVDVIRRAFIGWCCSYDGLVEPMNYVFTSIRHQPASAQTGSSVDVSNRTWAKVGCNVLSRQDHLLTSATGPGPRSG